MIILRILVFLPGIFIVVVTLGSAIKTFVLPRGASDRIAKFVFRTMSRIFHLYTDRVESFARRDSAMALFAPVTLLVLAMSWMALIGLGYMLMFWSIDDSSLGDAFLLSGSSLLTLGFALAKTLPQATLAFSEAAIGLILIALLISYLPTMYSAFARREAAVTLLAVRAGEPPSASELLSRYARIQGLDKLDELWPQWELWFAEIEENHTSLGPLVFFRSPQPDHSWVTAAGAVLDAAALRASAIDLPRDPQAELTIRAGFLALRRIAAFFGITYPSDPHFPETPISIAQYEFLQACSYIAESGAPIKADLEQAWRDFAGWRVNYDAVLLAMAQLTMAPYAPWSSDRTLPQQRLPERLTLGEQAQPEN